jgi:excisionase family DNA binding protein
MPADFGEERIGSGQAAHQQPPFPSPAYAAPLLSTAEVAARFGRTDRTIRRWISVGHLVPVRVGGAVFFHAEDINRLLSTRMSDAILRGRHSPDGPT